MGGGAHTHHTHCASGLLCPVVRREFCSNKRERERGEGVLFAHFEETLLPHSLSSPRESLSVSVIIELVCMHEINAEDAAEFQMNEINPEFINSIRKNNAPGFEPPSAEKLKFIKEKARLDQFPPELRQSYLRLLVKNHQAVSQHKFDLGRASTLMHDIELKTNEPIYAKTLP